VGAAGPAPVAKIAIFLAVFEPHIFTDVIVVTMVAIFAASMMAVAPVMAVPNLGVTAKTKAR